MFKFESVQKTDIGMKRSKNQDSIFSNPELGLYIVADGMGGHQGGETASQMAVEVIPKSFESQKNSKKPQALLQEAIQLANHSIFQAGQEKVELQGMGTTVTSIYFHGKEVTIGHVGDSRCYLLDEGCIWQLTKDHSVVQEKVRAGVITRQEAKTDSMKNVITRSVGFESNVNVDLYHAEAKPNNVFLLCSDGLYNLIEDYEILKIYQKNSTQQSILDSLSKTAEELIQVANSRGGDDNISILIVQVI